MISLSQLWNKTFRCEWWLFLRLNLFIPRLYLTKIDTFIKKYTKKKKKHTPQQTSKVVCVKLFKSRATNSNNKTTKPSLYLLYLELILLSWSPEKQKYTALRIIGPHESLFLKKFVADRLEYQRIEGKEMRPYDWEKDFAENNLPIFPVIKLFCLIIILCLPMALFSSDSVR